MAKSRIHTLKIRVRFDRPCNRSLAVREVRDSIHGEFYTTPREDKDPESFKVKAILSLPSRGVRR